MSFEWSNDEILRFLELYARERVIWDLSDKSHKQKHKVNDAWKRISASFYDVPIKELKAKRKSLMATFRPLLKKLKSSEQSGAGDDEVSKPTWFAFDTMASFLSGLYDVEYTINIEEEPSHTEVMSPSSPPCVKSSSYHQKIKTYRTKMLTSNKCNNISTSKTSNYKNRSHNTEGRFADAKKKMNGFYNLNQALKCKEKEDDECDIYAKLLAKRLRKYPEGMRDKIMYKIDGLLLNNPYPSDSSSPQSTYTYYQNSTPSPVYISPSPVYIPPSPGQDSCEEVQNEIQKINSS